MKNAIKKAISVLLVAVMVFGAAPLAGFVGLKDDFTTTAHAQSGYLSDENIARFIDLFYIPGTETAKKVEGILSGKLEPKEEEINDIFSKISLFYGVTSVIDVDNLTASALKEMWGGFLNAVTGIFDIIDNYQQMQSTDSAFKKTIDGLQISSSFLQILGCYIPPSFSLALSAIDASLNIARYLAEINIRQSVEQYYGELLYEYYSGVELTYRTANNVSWLGISQEEADKLYSAAYFKVYFMQCMDRIGNNSGNGTTTEPEPIPVDLVRFGTDSYTIFLNYKITNIATAYPSNADDTGITYFSKNTSVATVNSNGEITPVSPGTVNIVAEASNGVYDIFELTVLPYTANITDGKITILSYEANEKNVTIPSSVNDDVVTGIGNSAFSGCTGITSITIPDSVTSIANSAFGGCTGLTSVTIGSGIKSIGSSAFRDCISLARITIPDSVTSIGDSAFESCAGLTSVTIGSGIKNIGSSAFRDCSSLASITIPKGLTTIEQYTFYNCVSLKNITIPASVTSIGDCAFQYCSSLVSVKIPESVTCICNSVFSFCSNLRDVYYMGDLAGWFGIEFWSSSSNPMLYADNLYINGVLIEGDIVIPDGITDIGNYAFAYCTGLTSVTIPDSVTSIGDRTFYNCTGLTSVTIPDSVTSIGNLAFYNCTSLTSVTIPDSVTSIGVNSFRDCTSLTSVTIPDSVTSIGGSAFYNCTSLTSITIPDSVTSIGRHAFYNCTSLTTAIINGGSIGSYAFSNCNSLASITLGNRVSSIDGSAFEDCTSLTNLAIPDSVTSISSSAFYDCTSLTSITVDKNNKNYSSDEFGVLYNRDKTKLIRYPAGNTRTSYTIPGNVTSIGANAFRYCTGLTYVSLPDNITSIGNNAFNNCTSLTSLTIPESVTSISYFAFENCAELTSVTIPDSVTNIVMGVFSGCTALTDVYFLGSEKQWNAIEIETYNECLMNAKIHFNHVHNYSETVVVPAKCLSDGEGYGTCICGHKTENYVIPATGHKYQSVKTSPTCLRDGYISYTCGCGYSYTEPVSATGHTSGEWETTKEATCTETGSKVKKCTFCSEILEMETIPATGHVPSEWETVIEATCTTKGKRETKCTDCGIIIKTLITPFASHSDLNSDGLCDRCDKITNKDLVKGIRISIFTPETRTINYSESVKLYANAVNLPEGYRIKWDVEGTGVSIKQSSSGETCTVTSTSSGNVVVKAYVVDSNGKVVCNEDGSQIYDSEYFYSDANLWLMIVYFFKKLFGLTKIIPEAFKGIY